MTQFENSMGLNSPEKLKLKHRCGFYRTNYLKFKAELQCRLSGEEINSSKLRKFQVGDNKCTFKNLRSERFFLRG